MRRVTKHGAWSWLRRAAVGVMALALIGAPYTGGSAAPAQDTAVILQGADIVTLEPYYSQSLPDTNAIIHMFETLTRFGDNLQLLPGSPSHGGCSIRAPGSSSLLPAGDSKTASR